MIRQPHKNLFFSYRGSRPRKGAQHAIDRQLEDNVTKALVYVLEHCSRRFVLAPFLQKVVGLRPPSGIDEVQFALQRVDIARPTIKRRIALGIAPDSRIDPHRSGLQQSGRPDAWIWADERFAILVETKVRGAVSRHQIQRHIQGAEGWSSTNSHVVSQSWASVYDFFSHLRRASKNLDVTTRMLVDEFVRYLRMIALASDTTFDLDDFGYFLLKEAERDAATRVLLRRKLLRFTEELTRTRALRNIVRRYGGSDTNLSRFVNPGVFPKGSDNYWITVSPKERRDRCHFTVRLGQNGISLQAFSPHQSFTKRLVAKIAKDAHGFVASFRTISRMDPFVVRLREAYYKDPHSPYKGQRIGRMVDFLNIHPRVLTAENVPQFIVDPIRQRFSMKNLRPEIFLIRHFQLSEVVGNSDVVAQVSDAAEQMLGYLNFALDV
jgi:hypothetical protein